MEALQEKSYNDLLTEVADLREDNLRLRELLRLAYKDKYSFKSESTVHPGMKPLFEDFKDKEPREENEGKSVEVKPHERKIKRKPLPPELEREEIIVDLSDEEKSCPCCQNAMEQISEKISEKLDFIPAKVTVKKFVRPVYSCTKCQEAKSANMPAHPIPKAQVTINTLANILTLKYVDGLPLYRIEEIIKRSGVEISRDRLSRWVIQLAELAMPVRQVLLDKLLQCPQIAMDETYFQVLKEQGRQPQSKSFMLVQGYNEGNGRSITTFHYETSRSTETVGKYLKDFKGKLQTDGLEVYSSYCLVHGLVHGGCWAHGRRKFNDALKGKKKGKNSLAAEMVVLIDKLFEIEREIKGKPPDEILKERGLRSRPIVEQMEEIIRSKINALPAKSLTGIALRYLNNQWEKLTAFLTHPELELSNNFIERQIKHFATGRKSWMFADTVAGAHASAIFFSLAASAKLNKLNPYEYFKELLTGLAEGKSPEALLPFSK